jgi:hypothetical protein
MVLLDHVVQILDLTDLEYLPGRLTAHLLADRKLRKEPRSLVCSRTRCWSQSEYTPRLNLGQFQRGVLCLHRSSVAASNRLTNSLPRFVVTRMWPLNIPPGAHQASVDGLIAFFRLLERHSSVHINCGEILPRRNVRSFSAAPCMRCSHSGNGYCQLVGRRAAENAVR